MTGSPNYRACAERYAAAHGAMTAQSIDAVVALCSDDVRFHDPFNDTRGKAELTHLFADIFKTTRDPRTEVVALFGAERTWIIKWRFRAGLPVIGVLDVIGLTELTLAEDGLVAAHLDYWDSGPAIYGRLPLVGTLVRWVRGRLAAKSRR